MTAQFNKRGEMSAEIGDLDTANVCVACKYRMQRKEERKERI